MIGRQIAVTAAVVALGACGMGSKAADAEVQPLYVTITADGAMLMDGDVVDAAAIRRRAGPNARVLLRSDSQIQPEQFFAVMKQLEGLNLPIALIGQDAAVQ